MMPATPVITVLKILKFSMSVDLCMWFWNCAFPFYIRKLSHLCTNSHVICRRATRTVEHRFRLPREAMNLEVVSFARPLWFSNKALFALPVHRFLVLCVSFFPPAAPPSGRTWIFWFGSALLGYCCDVRLFIVDIAGVLSFPFVM